MEHLASGVVEAIRGSAGRVLPHLRLKQRGDSGITSTSISNTNYPRNSSKQLKGVIELLPRFKFEVVGIDPVCNQSGDIT
jgi:hypothetical protein